MQRNIPSNLFNLDCTNYTRRSECKKHFFTVIRLVQTQDTLLCRQQRMSTRCADMSNQLDTLVRRQGWFMLRDMTLPELRRNFTGEPRVPSACVSKSRQRPEEPQPSTSATNDDNRAFVLPQHLETPSKRPQCGYRDVEDGRYITNECYVYRHEWF